MTWQATQNVQLITDGNPDRLRVETIDGRRVTLLRPVVVNDSLRGLATVRDPSPIGRLEARRTSTIALADIQKVSVRRVNAGRTALLFLPDTGGSPVAAEVATRPSRSRDLEDS